MIEAFPSVRPTTLDVAPFFPAPEPLSQSSENLPRAPETSAPYSRPLAPASRPLGPASKALGSAPNMMVEQAAPSWVKKPRLHGQRSFDFMAKCSKAGGKVVEWPPRYGSVPDGLNAPSAQAGPDPNLTTVTPSVFKMRSQAPVQQAPPEVYSAQPAFKSTRPIRMRGDAKWPPGGANTQEPDSQQVREFVKPRRQNKDYSQFFAQNALPCNYTGYRAPPGTQHVGESDM